MIRSHKPKVRKSGSNDLVVLCTSLLKLKSSNWKLKEFKVKVPSQGRQSSLSRLEWCSFCKETDRSRNINKANRLKMPHVKTSNYLTRAHSEVYSSKNIFEEYRMKVFNCHVEPKRWNRKWFQRVQTTAHQKQGALSQLKSRHLLEPWFKLFHRCCGCSIW